MDINRINSVAVVGDSGETEAKFQTRREVAQAVTAVNSAKLFGQDSELTFAMDRETRRTVVRLVDRNSRKVIRQIPSEEVLALARNLPRAAHPR
jgi:flagellar protein FlaG